MSQLRLSVLPPPARAGAGLASPAPFSPAQQRRFATRAPQAGQEAGAPAARRPPPVKWSPRLDSSPCLRWVRTRRVPSLRRHPAFPCPLHFSFSEVFSARLEEWSRVNALQGLEAERQGESLGFTRDLGSPFQRAGLSNTQAFPSEWQPGPCVRMPAQEGKRCALGLEL